MRPSAAHMEPGAGVTARDMRTRSARPARGPQNTGELLKATPPARARMGGAREGKGSLWAWSSVGGVPWRRGWAGLPGSAAPKTGDAALSDRVSHLGC